MTSIISRKKVRVLLIIAFWTVVWQVLAMVVHQPLLLPTPWMTLKALAGIAVRFSTWKIILSTAVKILAGYFAALIISLIFAVTAYKHPLFEEVISPVITLMKSIPVASFIVLALAWLRADNISIFITAFVVFPVMYAQFYMSLCGIGQELLDMCRVFKVPESKKMRYLYIPRLAEALHEAVTTTIGMGVRAAVAAELIGIPIESVGEAIYKAKLYFDIAELFAWTILIILLCFVLEKGLKAFLYFLKRSIYD